MGFKSKGQSSQGSKLKIETGAGTAQPATAISAADPPVVSDTTPPAAGSYVKIDAATVDDMEGNASIVGTVVPATSYELPMLDFTGLGASGAATLTQMTMTDGCEVNNFSGFDGQAGEIDVTTMCSTAKEYVPGLQDFGNFQFDVNLVPDDPFQAECMAAKAAGEARWFVLLLPDGTTQYMFKAFVRQFSISGGVDAKLAGSVTLRITGEPVLYAP